jgi:hypothetical protein
MTGQCHAEIPAEIFSDYSVQSKKIDGETGTRTAIKS